jgi:hypothetical protein
MNKKYGTERWSHGIIIRRISGVATRISTKTMACKFLKKFRKEEVSARVFTAESQCVEGTTLSWAPYLLNLFLDDCNDAQGLGTQFHYSWLLILIAVMGWKESKYSIFDTKPKPATKCDTYHLDPLHTPRIGK